MNKKYLDDRNILIHEIKVGEAKGHQVEFRKKTKDENVGSPVLMAEDRRSAFGVCFKIKFQDLEAIHQGFQGDEKLNKSHIPHSKYWRRTILVHFDGEDRYEEMFCSCPKKN
jgi:hypothetical protein